MRNTRTEFTKETKRQAYARSAGICECHLIPHVFPVACGRPLGDGNTFYEHIICDGIGGDNSLSNCAVLTKTCWKFKTHIYDQKTVAKSKRVSDLARNIRSTPFRPLPGAKASHIRKRMDGTIINRHTGEEIGRRR